MKNVDVVEGTGLEQDYVGANVMIRTYSAGVHFGHCSRIQAGGSEYNVKLTNAVRVYSWTGANSLSQLATEGSGRDGSRLSVRVPSILLKAIEVIEMTDSGYDNLMAIKTWKF